MVDQIWIDFAQTLISDVKDHLGQYTTEDLRNAALATSEEELREIVRGKESEAFLRGPSGFLDSVRLVAARLIGASA